MIRAIFISVILISFTGCSNFSQVKARDAVPGAALGGIAGAGTGAIIGSVIANGDIVKSALLGGGIGIPLGIMTAVAIASQQEESELDKRKRKVRENQEEILKRREEINTLRQELYHESEGIELPSDEEYLYDGASIGNYGY